MQLTQINNNMYQSRFQNQPSFGRVLSINEIGSTDLRNWNFPILQAFYENKEMRLFCEDNNVELNVDAHWEKRESGKKQEHVHVFEIKFVGITDRDNIRIVTRGKSMTASEKACCKAIKNYTYDKLEAESTRTIREKSENKSAMTERDKILQKYGYLICGHLR